MPDENEELSIAEAAHHLGVSQSAISQLANSAPSDVVRTRGKRRVLLWPAFPIYYRQRITKDQKPANLADAQARRAVAEAELAELRVEQERGNLVTVAEFTEVFTERLARLRTTLENLPARFASRTVGLESLRQSQVVWDRAINETLRILSHTADADA